MQVVFRGAHTHHVVLPPFLITLLSQAAWSEIAVTDTLMPSFPSGEQLSFGEDSVIKTFMGLVVSARRMGFVKENDNKIKQMIYKYIEAEARLTETEMHIAY